MNLICKVAIHAKLCQKPWIYLKKTDLNSSESLASKSWKILCVIESYWFIHKSDGRKPD